MDIKKSIKNSDVKSVLAQSLVFLLPFLTLISKNGVGACSFGFLLLAIWCYRDAGRSLRQHYAQVRAVLATFLYGFLFTGLVVLLHPDFILRFWEKPSRMMLAASAMLVVLALRPSRRTLWYGLVAGAVAGASLVVYQRWVLGVDRPGGDINAITFADIVLSMGLMSLAGILDFQGRQRILPLLGAVAGLVGTFTTGTRGGWIVLLLAVPIFLTYAGSRLSKNVLRRGVVIALAAVAAVCAVPQTRVQERVAAGIHDVRTYYSGPTTNTNSLGVRFELWRAGLALAARHPLGPANPRTLHYELEQLAAQGKVSPVVLQYEHFHNEMLQDQLVFGLGGLLAYLLSTLVPFAFFLRILNRHRTGGGPALVPALAGLLFVLGYFSFGLTEVIFWSVRSCMFYALMLFVLMGMCINAEQEKKQ